jgi:hypothetical protein
MASQKKKDLRITIDRGNIYDPGNYHPDRDYNPAGLTKITKEIIDFYLPCGNMNCPLDYFRKILKLDIEPPQCFSTCNKKIHVHGCGPNSQYPVVEFMTKYVKKDPLRIFIKRPDALFNHYHNLPFIFRPDWKNGFILHHVLGAMQDNPLFTRMIKVPTHNLLNSKLRKIDERINQIQILIDSDENNISLKKALSELKSERFKISNVENDPEFWIYIEETYKKISNISEV